MPTERRSLPASTEARLQKLREAFRRLLHQQRHRLREIEASVGRSEGYFYKFPAGKATMTVELLLHTLDAMDVDAGEFFANALGAATSSEVMLEALEGLGPVDKPLVLLERAARRLEQDSPAREVASAEDPEVLVADIAQCSGIEQRRRLGTARRYHSHAFAAAYLEYLDSQRYDDPRQAALSARTVTLKLLPRLGGPVRRLLELQATALGVYGSAHRQMGGFATAARSIRLALDLARRHRLALATARLLQRAAYVLSDHGRYDQAAKVLDEALLIGLDLDDKLLMGMLFVDRGFNLNYQGDFRGATRSLKRGLSIVGQDPKCPARTKVAIYQALAFAYQNTGELARAEASLEKALDQHHDQGEINWAKLMWIFGSIAFKRASYSMAEDRLRRAKDVFDKSRSAERGLVSLDLARALLAQGKAREALALSLEMLDYLSCFAGNRVARAAISSFTQTAAMGKVSIEALQRLREGLTTADDRARRRQ